MSKSNIYKTYFPTIYLVTSRKKDKKPQSIHLTNNSKETQVSNGTITTLGPWLDNVADCLKSVSPETRGVRLLMLS